MIYVPKGTFIEPYAQHIQKRNVYKPQRINYKESSKMVYSRFSHSYKHNINNDYYRPNNHKNKILVNTKSDYPLPKFIRQGTNIIDCILTPRTLHTKGYQSVNLYFITSLSDSKLKQEQMAS